MKTKQTSNNRVAPYIAPRRALHPNAATAAFANTKVKEAPSLFDRGRNLAYVLFKASPFAAAAFPHPITCGIAVASAAESLYHARHGGIADKLEAFALLGGSISGAAAQTFTYTYQGNNQLRASWGDQTALLNCTSPYAFRRNETQNNAGDYLVCNLKSGSSDIAPSSLVGGAPPLPIPHPGIIPECASAYAACAPSRPVAPPNITFAKAPLDRLYILNNGSVRAEVSCHTQYPFRANESYVLPGLIQTGTQNYLTCNLPGGYREPISENFLSNAVVLPIPNDQMKAQCEAAHEACNPEITYTRLSNNTLLTNDGDNINCNSTTAFRGDVGIPNLISRSAHAYDYCSLPGGNIVSLPEALKPSFHLENITAECIKAKDACNTPPTVITPLKPTTIGATTPVVLTQAPTEVIEAAPAGVNVIGLALGIPVGLGFTAVLVSCGGVITWLVYKINKDNGKVDALETPPEHVAVQLNQFNITEQVNEN